MVYDTRQSAKAQLIRDGVQMIENRINPIPQFQLIYQQLLELIEYIKLRQVGDHRLCVSQQLNQISTRIKLSNIPTIPRIESNAITPDVFTSMFQFQLKIHQTQSSVQCYEHLIGLIMYAMVLSLGHRHKDERVRKATPLTQLIGASTASPLYRHLLAITNFGKMVTDFKGLFWMNMKSTVFGTKLKKLYKLLNSDHDILNGSQRSNNGVWTADSLALFKQLL